MEHLLENNLLNQSQHGFMPRKSCCTNLLEFFEAATKSVDAGNPFDVIFLEFAKAFDKVPRERLLEKIQAHGVRGNILAWIRESHRQTTEGSAEWTKFRLGGGLVWSTPRQSPETTALHDLH